MTSIHHQQMAPYAENMVDVTRRHVNTRSDFDRDFIGHYSGKAHRKGHTDRIMQEEVREERLRTRNYEHRKFGFGEDEISQIEAEEEIIREKEDRHRRMGYEGPNKDNVSSSLLWNLPYCLCFTNLCFV